MIYRIITFFCILAVSTLPIISRDQTRQTVGLALSGGGAKGIAHIGVIQALEENDIPIDYVTGTSMGAIVGGLYAAGYTPAEMLDLILSREFSYWSMGQIDPNLTYYFNTQAPSPTMFSRELSFGKTQADSVASSIISGLPMSFAFMELFSCYTAGCDRDFNRLFVPYRSVAADVQARKKYVFRKGSLGDAIRSSMTFPIVFQPISVDGRLLYDGGIYENFPVTVMREEFAPSIMIGVDVSSSTTGPETSLMDQLDNLVIQNNDYTLPDDEGIKLKINLNRFSLLDFPKALEIYRIGYDHAMANMDSIKSRIKERMPATTRNLQRQVFKARQPHLRFDSVAVSGGSENQNDYIAYLFSPKSDSDTLGIDEARDAYYRAISLGRLRELHPTATYNDSTGNFTLNMKASVKGGYKGSFGGYLSSSANTFLYASIGYSTLNYSRMGVDLDAWLGQAQLAAVLNGRIYLRTPVPSAISLMGVASREKFYENGHAFFDATLPTSIVNDEYFGRATWSFATGHHGAIDIGGGFGYVKHSFNLIKSDGNNRLYSSEQLWQIMARFKSSTLDNFNFPLSGHSIDATAMWLTGRNSAELPQYRTFDGYPTWVQLEVKTRHYPEISKKVTLGIETNLMLSSRELMPTYSATLASAPAYSPTPASSNVFRADLRSNSFVAAGLIPVYKFSSSLSARIGGYVFMPIRKIEQLGGFSVRYGNWLNTPKFFGEADLTYHFPFGSLTAYTNYTNSQGNKWNVGISFGIFILPPKFLR